MNAADLKAEQDRIDLEQEKFNELQSMKANAQPIEMSLLEEKKQKNLMSKPEADQHYKINKSHKDLKTFEIETQVKMLVNEMLMPISRKVIINSVDIAEIQKREEKEKRKVEMLEVVYFNIDKFQQE